MFLPLTPEARHMLDGIPALIDRTFPLPGRFRSSLPKDVAELSRLLTSGSGEREISYMGRPNLLSAYLRFFLPWNIFRLCRLLPSLDLTLVSGDTIIDLGCGPMTFAASLWISRPDLRSLSLELRCIDRTGAVLDAGKKFFTALAGENCPWKIITVKDSAGTKGKLAQGAGKLVGKPAALVCAVNVFNEIYENIPLRNTSALDKAVFHSAGLLDSLAVTSASILVVEPGLPRWGEFISLLRGELIKKGRLPLSPCPHALECPFPGGLKGAGKKRWCHFAFETEDAPAALHRLSAAAGLPKERAVLSFLFAGDRYRMREHVDGNYGTARAPKKATVCNECVPALAGTAGEEHGVIRIISDAFPLTQGQWGRYACSDRGLVLAVWDKVGKSAQAAAPAVAQAAAENCRSGTLINAVFPTPELRDAKSGALVVRG